jgi:hypothetical protein
MIHRLKRAWFVFRSAVTGKFISRKEAEAHPETSTKERVLRDHGDLL